MAWILCIETATEVCSVGLGKNGVEIEKAESSESYQHARLITILIESILNKAGVDIREIDAVAVSGGPGSYTGLRIGASVAKGLCYSLDLPLIAISTLQSLAFQSATIYPEADFYIPMIDARRNEVYCSIYNCKKELIEPEKPLVLDTDSFAELSNNRKKLVFSGNATKKARILINNMDKNFIFSSVTCSASNLIPLAEQRFSNHEFEDLAYYNPFYLKAPHITKPKKIL